MKSYHRIKKFSISICILSFLAVVSFSVFGYFLGFQTKSTKAQYGICDSSNMPQAAVTTDATTAYVTIIPATIPYNFHLTTSADNQDTSGTVSGNSMRTFSFETDTISDTNELVIVASSVDGSCTDYPIYDQTLAFVGTTPGPVYLDPVLKLNDGIRVHQGDPVSFSIENPGSLPVYVDILLSNGSGSFYLRFSKQQIDAGQTSGFTVKIANPVDTAGLRTIEVDSYQSQDDSEFIATTSGTFTAIPASDPTVNITGDPDVSAVVTGGTIATPSTASSISTPGDLINNINILFFLLIGGLAVLGIVIGGVQYLTASGDQAKAEKGKKTLIYSIIGIVVAVLSYVIINIISCTISSGSFNVTCGSSSPASFNWNLKDLIGPNPTGMDLNKVGTIINTVTSWALDFAGLAAFIMILYSSIIYLTSYGEESKAETAKKSLMWSVIGLAVAILSKVLLANILYFFKQ